MFLSRFRVRGYKCLEDLELALTPIHVLIGPGDCGKTSLLEAISAFYGRLKTPATQWFPAVAGPRELISHDSSVPTIDLAGQWSEVQSPGGPPRPGVPGARRPATAAQFSCRPAARDSASWSSGCDRGRAKIRNRV